MDLLTPAATGSWTLLTARMLTVRGTEEVLGLVDHAVAEALEVEAGLALAVVLAGGEEGGGEEGAVALAAVGGRWELEGPGAEGVGVDGGHGHGNLPTGKRANGQTVMGRDS